MEESGIRYISDAGGDNADDTAAVSPYFAGSFFLNPPAIALAGLIVPAGVVMMPFSVLKEWSFSRKRCGSLQMEDSAFSA